MNDRLEKMKFKWIFRIRDTEIPTLTLIIFLIAFIWAIGTAIAPFTLPENSINDLTGKVGPVDNADITEDMNPYAKFYYQAGDTQCHTIKERSFFLNGNQMPFCVRDVAIFFGLALGFGIALFIFLEIKLWWLIGGLVPIGIDGTVQLLTPYESNNILRLATGLLAGLVPALALGSVMWDTSRSAEMKQMAVPSPPMVNESHEQQGEIEPLLGPTDDDMQSIEENEIEGEKNSGPDRINE
jgi:uncharacterized membrane protein